MKKSLGILGGMGPMATVDLFRKIVELTEAESDQEHIRIYIDDNTRIPDRTAAILYGAESPLAALIDSLRKLESMGAEVIIMPCNTAHFFLPELLKLSRVPFLNITEVSAEACVKRFPGRRAALLATSGALSTGLYQQALMDRNIPFIVPDELCEASLMRVIYDGVKAGRDPSAWKDDFTAVLDMLSEEGADYYILGCTELPLALQALSADIPVIDPTEELARAAIRYCGYRVRGE